MFAVAKFGASVAVNETFACSGPTPVSIPNNVGFAAAIGVGSYWQFSESVALRGDLTNYGVSLGFSFTL